MNYRSAVCLVFFMILLTGCGGSSTGGSGGNIDSADLLGLTEDHSLEYFQIDTTITYVLDTTVSPDPFRHDTVTTITRTFNIALDDNNWIISDGSQPLLNLIVSGSYVLHNGYYSASGPSAPLIYFQSPAILMTDAPKEDETWKSYTEPYRVDGDSLTFNGYFAYFGFYSEKSYIEKEEIIITSGAYQVHRFEVDLFANATDTIPIAHATEYYATGLGLVKLRFEDAGFIRTLILLRSY